MAPPADDTHARDRANFRASIAGPEPYTLGPDSLPQAGVPRGVVTAYTWHSAHHFAGTTRDYWLYVPAQYDPAQPAALMVWQDGTFYLRPEVNAPTVFDNLIHQGAMPVTLEFIFNPGRHNAADGEDSVQRSLEYNGPGTT